MRGSTPPWGIIWTRFDSLPPLPPQAAKDAFLAINSLSSDEDSGNRDSLDTLLEEMDYVPLAIRLLAQVSIGYSSRFVLKRWRQEKTAMLRTAEGRPDKLENIDVSIALSITALDVTNNPEAVHLLEHYASSQMGFPSGKNGCPSLEQDSDMSITYSTFFIRPPSCLLQRIG